MNRFLLNYYHQSHLLKFYKTLNKMQKQELKNDIKKIDFKLINSLYVNSYKDDLFDVSKVSNLKCIYDINDKDRKSFCQTGKNIIINNEYAIVIMAGGNASRLGLDIPKGTLELNIKGKMKSLFETYIGQLKSAHKKYGVYISLYIMVSTLNREKTIDFFENHKYFDYPKDKIIFFTQGNLPILDVKGKIILSEKHHVAFGPRGNGDVFNSLENNGLIKKMKQDKIKYILFTTVDNILTKLVDPCFIGSTVDLGYDIGTKTLLKEDEQSKNYVFCKYNGHPSMIPSQYITPEVTNAKDDDGNYIFRDINITYHMISLSFLDKISKIEFGYNRTYKKNKYVDDDGIIIEPSSPNSFKFEKLIFNSFKYADDMLLYRVKNDEFLPIKNKEDIKKVEEYFQNRTS